jgi:type VI protein secretion system component Hcp
MGNPNMTAYLTDKILAIYYKIRLENVLVSRYEMTHREDGSEAQPIEYIKLNFTKVEITHTPFDKDHKAGSPVTAGYDLETAQAL